MLRPGCGYFSNEQSFGSTARRLEPMTRSHLRPSGDRVGTESGPSHPGSHPGSSIADDAIGEISRQRLQAMLGLKDDEHFRKKYLLPALEAGFIEMTDLPV